MSTPTTSAGRNSGGQRDNLLGICAAIGEDFGFNPLLLRIALAVMIIVSPKWMLIAYGTMGLAVLASRLLVREPKRVRAAPAPAEREGRIERRELALAA